MSIIKVLYVHHTGDMDGSSISLLNLISSLDCDRILPRVLLAKDGNLRHALESRNIKVDILPIDNFWTFPGPGWSERGFLTNFRAFIPNKRLESYLEFTKPDIVHINDKVLVSAGIAAHKHHYPIVWHSRTTYHITKSKINALISSSVISHLADCIIAISEDEVDRFEKFKKLSIINNSVNLDDVHDAINSRITTRKMFRLDQDDLGVGFLGPLTELRGAWDFMKAAGIIKGKYPEMRCKYFMVGKIPVKNKGGIRAKLGLDSSENSANIARDLARDANILDSLTITGFRADALNVMAALDILVVYSRRGVLGRPPLEAAAMGVPVIVAAGHSGNSKIVIGGRTGLVIPPANPVELAKAIHTLAVDPELRIHLSDNGKLHACVNFDPKKNAEKVMEIYQVLLSQGAL